VLTISQSSPSYSPHLTCNHTRRVLLAIVLTAGTLIDIVLLTVYCSTSRCLCHSESCANLVTKLAIILAASYLQSYFAASYSLSSSPLAPSLTSYSSLCIVQLPGVSVTLRAVLTMSQSSQSYLPCPTCYRPRRRWCAHRHPPHSRRAHRVVFISSSSSRRAHRIVLIVSCSTRSAHRVVLITSCSTRRVVFANFPLFPREVW